MTARPDSTFSPAGLQILLGSRLSKQSYLTKKDVFRWSLDFGIVPKSSVTRSDYFDFTPTPNAKYCLVLTKNFLDFDVGLCRSVLPGWTVEDMPIKVSFSVLDNGGRCHHTIEKVFDVGMDLVAASFDHAHNTRFFNNNSLRIQCSLDVKQKLEEPMRAGSQAASKHEISIDDGNQDLSSELDSLLQNGQHSDVILSLSGEEFKAHRSILAARSSVFAAMFQHDTVEKQTNRVDITDVTCDTMGHLLHFLYTGKVNDLSTEEFLSLFVAADKYELPKLKKQCSNSISPKITSDMALSVLTLAYLHQDDQLKSSAIDAVLDNALQVMKSEEWLVFLREYPELANNVILKALKSRGF